MDKNDIEINSLIMREIGLETDSMRRIVDQDTGICINIKGKTVVAPGYTRNNTVEFDPHNNRNLMKGLFGYFLDKLSDESDIGVRAYFNVDDGDNKSHMECILDDNTRIVSKPYLRDSLRCVDIMSQLNGGESPDLSKYDVEKPKPTVINKRRATSNGNKSDSKTRKNSK